MLKPPFTALNMQGLSSKVCRGVYPALSSTYSKTLSDIIKKMLQVSPSLRPTSFELLELPELEINLGETCAKLSSENQNKDLLATILMPRDLKQLANRLPRSKYSGNKLRRMNSEPARMPSVHQSRLGSASSRKRWNLDKPSKFEPRSAFNSQKKEENYHLMKKSKSNRYFSKENLDRGVLQRAAEAVLPTSKRRVVDFSRRSSSNGRYSEERKIPTENTRFGQRQYSAQRRPSRGGPTGMQKPPLANVALNIQPPKIVNPYDNSPRCAKPPVPQQKAGLPPIGQKPGFGGVKRNVIQENYNYARGGFNRQNSNPYRFG